MNILILGASGMIGSTMLRVLTQSPTLRVTGAVRRQEVAQLAKVTGCEDWITGVDMTNPDHLTTLFRQARPQVVINCAGLTKHLPEGNAPIPALSMNALLPQRLAELCSLAGARLIHVSTDCVFSGRQGHYIETDHPDSTDVYGKTKHLGEIDGPGLLTVRTSTIGHEIGTRFGLLEWFLSQTRCKGYSKAIFSGLPSVEFARVVRDVIIPDTSLEGLYHVGADAIDKDSLLRLIAQVYGRDIEIETDDKVVIDRSLNSTRFNNATGYQAPSWPALIQAMYQDQP